MFFIYPHAKFRVKIMILDFCLVVHQRPAHLGHSVPVCALLCTNGLHQWAVFAPQRALQYLLRKNSHTKFKTSRTIFCPNKIDIFRSTIKPILTLNSRPTIFNDFSNFLISKNRKYFFTQYFSFPPFFLDSYVFYLSTCKISGQNHDIGFLHALVLLLCHGVPTCALLCANGLHIKATVCLPVHQWPAPVG